MSEIPLKSVKKFYTLLFSGKISDAEKSLDYIKKKLGENSGYYRALYGIYYSYVNDDRDSYVFRLWERHLDGTDKNTLYNELKNLMDNAQQPPVEFIKTWLDLISMIDQLPIPHKLRKEEQQVDSSEYTETGEEEIEDLEESSE
ncbi:MAG: hypothetical protein QXK95_04955 [Nitrososphaerota archaeon]|nr:hypothetical protein [Candidatus Geocrenenecus dongiae]